MRSLVIVRNGELRVVIYALFRHYSNFITKYLVISLEPKETKFWTLVELFHKGILLQFHKLIFSYIVIERRITINLIANMFTTRIYNQEKKGSKELKLKKDETLQ